MTKIPKKQSFKPQYLIFPFLLLPLIGMFVYAAVHVTFFVYLAGVLFCSLLILVYFHFRLISSQSVSGLYKQELRERMNLLEVDIEKERVAIESLQEKIIDFARLKGLTEKLCLSFGLEEASRVLCGEVMELFGDEETTVILYRFHAGTGELGISSSWKGPTAVNVKAKKGDIFDEWVAKTMKPLLIEDAKSDFRFDIERISRDEQRPIHSLISVPLVLGEKAVGILRVDSPAQRRFSTEDIRFLQTIGGLGAVAIESAQLYERVEDLAIRDGLTGLFLRRRLLEKMALESRRELRRKTELSFLMVDLDKFKQYNDRFGHTAGDIVLKTMGLMLADMFDQPGNLVCRYGGEEFAVLLPDCPKEKAVERAEALRKKIEKQTIILRREKTKVTISVGVASFPRDAQLKEELIQQADQALYQAKKKGRNRVCAAE